MPGGTLSRAIARGLPCVAFLAGCGPPDDGTRSDGELAALTLLEEVRVGESTDPRVQLSNIVTIEAFEDGRFVVLDGFAPFLWFFEPDGTLIRQAGADGEGPGEIRRAHRMAAPRDSLWVLDAGTGHTSWFTSGGEFLGKRLLPFARETPGPAGWLLLPDGILSDGDLWGHHSIDVNRVVELGIDRLWYVRVGEDGESGDTIAPYPLGWLFSMDVGERRPLVAAEPFRDELVVRVSLHRPEAVHIEREAATEPTPQEIRVHRVAFNGDTIQTVVVPYEPIPFDPALADSAAEAIGERYRDASWPGAPTPARAAAAARSAMRVPTFHPPVSEAVMGRDGSVWLERERVGGTHVWVGIDVDGRVIGTVQAPGGLRVLAATADRWWAVELDELDVPTVVRYRVVEASS